MSRRKQSPPRWANRFLEWFCAPDILETAQGDLFELFEKRVAGSGRFRAQIGFIQDVLSFVRPFAIKKIRSNSNHFVMLSNYYKIAIRSLMRHKMYTSIKIGGFALGIAACLLIALFITHELSYDKHYADGPRIYRLINQWTRSGQEAKWPAQTAPLASVVKSDIPEVEKAGRLIPYNWYLAGDNLMRRADRTQNTYEDGFAYADQELLDLLEIPFLSGNPNEALNEPNTMVISARKAAKYFPDEDPVGRTIVLNDETKLTITGVMAEAPATSHIQFDFFITLAGEEFWPGEQTSWCCSNYDTYVKLRVGADNHEVLSKLNVIRDNYIIEYRKKLERSDVALYEKYRGFELQPIADVHLMSGDISDNFSHGDIKVIWMFGIIAMMVLLLACGNFINLSTAKSATRSREVGLRKVVGSHRSHLVGQFLCESILLSIFSFMIGVVLTMISLPYFNELANKSLALPWSHWWFVPLLIGFAIFIGLLAGIYPSLYLSGFRPIDVLRGSSEQGRPRSLLRSGLVVFQFTASIILVVGALTVSRQMSFILNKKLGFNKDQVMLIHGTNTMDDNLEPFKNQLLSLPEVQNVSYSNSFPISGTNRNQNEFWREGKVNSEESIGAQIWRIDPDYFPTLGMNVVEGRNFSTDLASDSSAIIINETMVSRFGFEDPIGQRITNGVIRTVIGVVEDFHYESVRGEIDPLCFVLGRRTAITAVKLTSGEMRQSVDRIAAVWDKMMPQQAFRFDFLDDRYARMYDDVKRTEQIFTVFAGLAIFIACMGLFALSAFIVERRRKEISIRKVLGASFGRLFQGLSMGFLQLVLVSLVLAIPIAWWVMQRWLENYEYSISLSWDVFLLSGSFIILIALGTISYEIIRALKVNPADTLHSE